MLSIIIVNYKNDKKTADYIKNEVCKINTPHTIIIVNNSATDESNHFLCDSLNAELVTDIKKTIDKNQKIFVVAHQENLGFARGNNLGAEFSLNHFHSDYFLFSNNDICILDDDVVEKMINKMEENKEIGMIGPNIIGHDQKRQSPYPYAPFWERYFWMYWLTPFLTKKYKIKLFQLNYSEEAEEGYHYRIMGSFFMVRAQDFVACEMMDKNTFLFGEEMILTERIHKIGKKVYFIPTVSVLHDHNVTISKFFDLQKQYKIRFSSEAYYYSKYRNVSRLSILIGKYSCNLYLKLIHLFK